tara:strand:- start:882 stop:1121 length:240 start_codon:yes stop_codon:yes gene_type:complete
MSDRLTPFEQAEQNVIIHRARIRLIMSVQSMVEVMQECDAALGYKDNDVIAETIRAEEIEIMKTLSDIADHLETQGISA